MSDKKINFLFSQLKQMLWVLKRTVSLRWFFRASKTNVKIDGLENISDFTPKLCFCLIRFFTSHQQSFSYKGTGLPGLNQYYARINVLAQGPQRSDASESLTHGPRSLVKHSTTEKKPVL